MDALKEEPPKRKSKEKSNGKGKRRSSKGNKSQNTQWQQAQTGDQEAMSSADEDTLIGRKSKKPKKARIGRTAGKNYPPEIQRALGRAHMLYVEGNVVEASKELSQVVVLCSSIPEPYALLALIYQDSGKYQEALMFYKLACARDPRKLGNHREAARLAGILGDHTSRLEALKVLARLQPNSLNIAIDRARCLLELQKPKQALEVYAKAAKRFPRRYDIYLDLAEGVECSTPHQHMFVQQALASCLRRAIGKKHLGPDVRDLADGFATRLRDMKLERPKPKRLPLRTRGLPSKRVGEVAMIATDLLVTKLMESRKRQEPQYEVGVQVVEGLVSWLDSCRSMADRFDAEYDSGEGEEADDEEDLDSDSDLRDNNDEDSEDEDDDSELDGGSSSAEEDLEGNDAENEDGEPMDHFALDPTTLLRYGICQLYCGEKEKASKAFAFLDHEEPEGAHGDMMLEIAKVYAETDNSMESLVLLRQVAQSMHPRHRLAGVQLGAAYASQGKHELAAEAYSAVLAERPHHATALAGFVESAYWRGKAAVPAALLALTPAVDEATGSWTDGGPADPSEDDEEGECAIGFQRLQLLMQWATLSRMNENTADFACVALPLVSVAIGQLAQHLEFERQQELAVLSAKMQGSTGSSGVGGRNSKTGVGSEQEGQVAEDKVEGKEKGPSDLTSQKKTQVAVWKPSPAPPLLGELKWQVGFRGRVSSLTQLILDTTDVITQVGRRAIFWFMVDVVRSLHVLGNSAGVTELVAAAIRSDGLLRGLEKEDLQAVMRAKDGMATIRTMPGGSPLHGPTSRGGLPSGSANPPELTTEPVEDTAAAIASFDQYYAPPWRCVEEKYDDGLPRRVGRAWRPCGRTSSAGPRRSRSRALMGLTDRSEDGDAICALVQALSRTSGNNATWNLLQRVVTERGVEASDGGFHGEKVEALISRHREQPHGLLYRAHDAAIWNRSRQALKLYTQAHVLRPEEPLPILCLANQIIRMVTAMETMVENDRGCILQALACFYRYAELRKSDSLTSEVGATTSNNGSAAITIPKAALEQEIFYNLGRGYHQVGLSELATDYYRKALRVEDERGHELRKWHGGRGVTRETAHNLCALYQKTGSTAMALRTLNKYLSVG